MTQAKLFNDHFQNYKQYGIPKAQLILTDIPYNLGNNAYASNPQWYIDGDNTNGESKLANKEFFDTDKDFRISEFLHFCTKMLRPEPKAKADDATEEAEKVGKKNKSKSPCMLVFCSFEQQFELIEKAKKYGLNKYINMVFHKDYSPQVLKANMKVLGNCEYAVLLYRDRLPKFNNNGRMIFNCMKFPREGNNIKKIHTTQKPIALIERLIEIFTDEGDVVIDPCAGSGSTLRAAMNLGRKAYGFEIKKDFFADANKYMLSTSTPKLF